MEKKRTEIAELGEFGLIDRLTRPFGAQNASTLVGPGDDAAVVAPAEGDVVLCSTDALYEGVDFDLTYFPLRHLGVHVGHDGQHTVTQGLGILIRHGFFLLSFY